MIVGGWEYVYAAYGLAWSGIALYGLRLWSLGRKPQEQALDEGT